MILGVLQFQIKKKGWLLRKLLELESVSSAYNFRVNV